MAKQYKSVSTIMEKVRMGELDFVPPPRLYSNIEYFQRPEIIKPYIHALDKRALRKAVSTYITNKISHSSIVQVAQMHQRSFMGTNKVIDHESLTKDMLEIWLEFPEELVDDIFNLNYTPIQSLKFKNRERKNKFRFRMLEKSTNPVTKVVTQFSNIKSMVYTRSMIQYFLLTLAILKQQDPSAYQKAMDDLQMQDDADKKSNKPKKIGLSFGGVGGKGDPKDDKGDANQNNGNGTSNQKPQQGSSNTSGRLSFPNIDFKSSDRFDNEDDDADDVDDVDDIDPDDEDILDEDLDEDMEESDQDGDDGDEDEDDEDIFDGRKNDDDDDNELLDNEDEEEFIPNNVSAESSGTPGVGNNNESLDSHLEKLLNSFENSSGGQEILDHLVEDARKISEHLDNILNTGEQEVIWTDLQDWSTSERAASKLNPAFLADVESQLRSVNINLVNVKHNIKSLLDKSIAYFSVNEKPIYENLFDVGNLFGFDEYELFHPKLRKLNMDDMYVKDTIKVGKIDIYVDTSGSMSSSCGILNADGSRMSRLLFAKAFAYRMKELRLLHGIFSFQEKVKYEGESTIDILSMTGGGGTSFHKVIRKIEELGRNAIIITDGEDCCFEYSNKAFFIGLEGCRFGNLNPLYLDNQQAVIFNGNTVTPVPPKTKEPDYDY